MLYMLDHALLILLLITVSIIAGILGSMLGLGGGFIIAPTLIMINIEPYKVSGTSLFTVFSTSLSSTISYSKQGKIDYRLAYRLALFAIPGSVIGAYISSMINVQEFKLYFAIILAGVSIHMLTRPYYRKGMKTATEAEGAAAVDDKGIRNIDYHSRYYHYYYSIIVFFSGLIASLFGIGGGVLLIPMMLLLMHIDMHKAVPNVQFVILTSSIIGLITHVILGHPDYFIASILVIGTFIGAQIGSRLINKVKDIILRRLVTSALLFIAARFIYDYLASSG
jgi:uncharacterized membrane protein YfcA